MSPVTSDPDVLMECLRRFDFDQILMALNAADPHHRSFMEHLLPMAVDKQMGIISMKIPARGRILSSWQPEKSHDTGWNQPAPKPGVLAMKEALSLHPQPAGRARSSSDAILLPSSKKTCNSLATSRRSAKPEWQA